MFLNPNGKKTATSQITLNPIPWMSFYETWSKKVQNTKTSLLFARYEKLKMFVSKVRVLHLLPILKNKGENFRTLFETNVFSSNVTSLFSITCFLLHVYTQITQKSASFIGDEHFTTVSFYKEK